ncbi:accessory gene regulator B family protein [Paenibacillus donghaensis]|uniref:Accessory regulator AgrB n=1 Tax=Paenibacillus donghaensis TaxID=414771 RepID=A0A2Z2KIN6_9BACL|nr:accessory gene regulator B family protein [Paenibacillus donghaensis]ASA20742.1 hypothetical protein B9T62_08050 [Paenibacillus donghaensis]
MIDQIVYHVSRKAVGYGVIEDKDLPVFRYGLISILEIFMIMSTMLFISIGMNCLIEAAMFVGIISVYRSFGGGYHANTFKSCYFISLLIFVAGLTVIKWLPVELYDIAN